MVLDEDMGRRAVSRLPIRPLISWYGYKTANFFIFG